MKYLFFIWLGALGIFSLIASFITRDGSVPFIKNIWRIGKHEMQFRCGKKGHKTIFVPDADSTDDRPRGKYVCSRCEKVTGGVGINFQTIFVEGGTGGVGISTGGSGAKGKIINKE